MEPELAAPGATHHGQGICAIVQFEYEVRHVTYIIEIPSDALRQAQEDNEMHLVEGELIEQIEQIDEGWWSGVGAGGKTGLFPGTHFYLVTVLLCI